MPRPEGAAAGWRLLALVGLLLWACSQAPPDEPKLPARPGLGHVAAKLAGDEPVRVAYLGGSITAVEGWRPLTTAWLRERFPAPIEEINAGLGGTDSFFGAFRLEADVLAHRPDLVFVEFAVNDKTAPQGHALRSLEGIVRKLLRAEPETDIVFVYAYAREFARDLAAGRMPQPIAEAERVARRYGIPSVPVARAVQRRLDDGSAVLKRPRPRVSPGPDEPIGITYDQVHPTAEGHRLYADEVVTVLERALAGPRVDRRSLLEAPPLDPGHFESATWVPIADVRRTGKWRRVNVPGVKSGHVFETTQPGSALAISFRGSAVDLLVWLRSGETGIVAVRVDDRPPIFRSVGRPIPAMRRAGQRVARLVEGLDPEVVHTLRVSLVPRSRSSRALGTLRAAAFLVRGEPVR